MHWRIQVMGSSGIGKIKTWYNLSKCKISIYNFSRIMSSITGKEGDILFSPLSEKNSISKVFWLASYTGKKGYLCTPDFWGSVAIVWKVIVLMIVYRLMWMSGNWNILTIFIVQVKYKNSQLSSVKKLHFYNNLNTHIYLLTCSGWYVVTLPSHERYVFLTP